MSQSTDVVQGKEHLWPLPVCTCIQVVEPITFYSFYVLIHCLTSVMVNTNIGVRDAGLGHPATGYGYQETCENEKLFGEPFQKSPKATNEIFSKGG